MPVKRVVNYLWVLLDPGQEGFDPPWRGLDVGVEKEEDCVLSGMVDASHSGVDETAALFEPQQLDDFGKVEGHVLVKLCTEMGIVGLVVDQDNLSHQIDWGAVYHRVDGAEQGGPSFVVETDDD